MAFNANLSQVSLLLEVIPRTCSMLPKQIVALKLLQRSILHCVDRFKIARVTSFKPVSTDT